MHGLGLYLHLPFCPARCPYCDFFALRFHPGQVRRLLAGLALHLERLAPLAAGRRLSTVYFGGGTPSMLPARDLAALLEGMDRILGIGRAAEISLEANPGTLGLAKLKALARAGFNRLSLGAQSFDSAMLAGLGRLHSPGDTRRAVDRARAAGFSNLNLDLIYGLPGQDQGLAARDLEAALELNPDHVSLYELTLSQDTPFGRRYEKGAAPLPNEEEIAAMETQARGRLARAGLARYEVSNFARSGRQCRHNTSTWAGGDYLALGPGAHGHLAGVRWALVDNVEEYCAALQHGQEPFVFREELTPEQRALELILLGLRTVDGVDMGAVGMLLGRDAFQHYGSAVAELQRRGWALSRDGRLVPTELGLDMADGAAALFA